MTVSVTTVRVSYLREKQPVQYEKATPFVEFYATVENEDPQVVAANLMRKAQTVVYGALAMGIPEAIDRILTDLQEGVESDEPPTKVSVAKAEENAALPASTGRSRGRPRKSTDVAPSSPAPEPEAAPQPTKPAPIKVVINDDNDIPDDDVPVKSTPKATVPTDDIPDDTVKPAVAPSRKIENAMDLQRYYTELLRANKIGNQDIKAVMASLKATRVSEINPIDYEKVVKMLDDIMAKKNKS